MLELSHIQYMVGEKRVLQNVSARFPAGHITGIIGPNGAGKTSLLRVAAGLAQVSAGTVMARGDFADAGWRAKNIAYMPQFQSVAWPLSVREVVALGLLPLNLGAAESEKRVDAALAALRHGAVCCTAHRYALGRRKSAGLFGAAIGDRCTDYAA